MKKLLLICLFFVSWTAAKAQDKIITIKQDTIECRILSVNADRISYEQKTADKLFVGKSIPTSEVLRYFRSGKADSFGHVKPKRKRPEHRWLFSMQGGLAHSLTDYSSFEGYLISAGNSESETDDYFSKLENGYHLNSSLHYLATSFFGFGVDYNLFYAAAKAQFMSQGIGNYNVPIYSKLNLDERKYTHFAGPSVLFQQFPDKKRKIKISETLSPGIVLLRDETRYNYYQPYVWYNYGYGYGYSYSGLAYYNQYNTLTTATTYGGKGSLSVEYGITPQLSAGLAGSFMWAQTQKISQKTSRTYMDEQELRKKIKISHIDYGFIVRYNF